jgi:hypothetical protein
MSHSLSDLISSYLCHLEDVSAIDLTLCVIDLLCGWESGEGKRKKAKQVMFPLVLRAINENVSIAWTT